MSDENLELEYLLVGPSGTMLDNTTFGSIIKSYRNHHHWSRRFLAETLRFSSEYIRLIEEGARVPPLESASKILDALKVPNTIDESRLLFDNYSVTFTSRIRSSRHKTAKGRRMPDAEKPRKLQVVEYGWAAINPDGSMEFGGLYEVGNNVVFLTNKEVTELETKD